MGGGQSCSDRYAQLRFMVVRGDSINWDDKAELGRAELRELVQVGSECT